MKLVFIYGPPAVGKLTVAEELSKITRYKLFHNHLTFDLVDSLFPYGSKNFGKMNTQIRLILFEEAAMKNVNLIFTYCYSNPSDNSFVKEVLKKVSKYKGKVCFVQLLCNNKEPYKRVKHKKRKKYGKLTKVDGFKKSIKKWNLLSSIPFVKSFNIDNTKISPKKIAQMIKSHYKL
ncbi:AAA family ATPase [Candidatus Woesearchaeota archaeon]|nr:AAA family ATPase [Candidatus Woesearchaeota archaeon]